MEQKKLMEESVINKKEICVDFDGTVVTHDYPRIGADIGAIPVLKKMVEVGHKLILFTMRSDEKLYEAVDWFNQNGIPLYGININPTQSEWTNSPKAYGQLYIDDMALGAPLITSKLSYRPYIDWVEVEIMLKEMGII